MRAGYLLIGVELALVKWPILPDSANLPLYEGATLCLLTAMSLLALLGLRHPVKMLPVLLFESAWKLLWLSLARTPRRKRLRVFDRARCGLWEVCGSWVGAVGRGPDGDLRVGIGAL